MAGSWEFALDPEGALSAGAKFEDSIRLPGTTDLAGKGNEPSETVVTVRLSRRHSYVGKAWYRKRITIPAALWTGGTVLILIGLNILFKFI